MKGTLKVLDASGHTTVEFDTEQGIVKEAEHILAQARMTSSMLFDGGSGERIGKSGQTPNIKDLPEHTVVVPPMAGG